MTITMRRMRQKTRKMRRRMMMEILQNKRVRKSSSWMERQRIKREQALLARTIHSLDCVVALAIPQLPWDAGCTLTILLGSITGHHASGGGGGGGKFYLGGGGALTFGEKFLWGGGVTKK
jgi:hypothetical protein